MPQRKRLPKNLVWSPDGYIHYRFKLDGHLFRGSCRTSDVTKAMAVLEAEEERAYNRIFLGVVEKRRVKFSEAFELHFRKAWRHTAKADWYLTQRDAIITVMGDFHLDEVTGDWCSRFVDARLKAGNLNPMLKSHRDISKHTVNHALKVTHTILRRTDKARYKLPPTTEKENGDDGFEIYLLPISKKERERNTVLADEAELESLLYHTVKHARPIILTMIGTGLRKQNVMLLNIENLHWNERTIEVIQKGGKHHTVAMTDAVYSLLRTATDGRYEGPVFIFGGNGCDCTCCADFRKPATSGKPHYIAGGEGKGTRKRVRCIETGDIFKSAQEAATTIGQPHSAAKIGKACRGESATNGAGLATKVEHVGSYHWEFVAAPKPKPVPNKMRRHGRINSIERSFNTARLKIGRGDVRIHDLRHSLATWMARRSQNLVVIKEILGHEDIRTTQRYLHPDLASTRSALEVISLPETVNDTRESA
jgi:integrase